MRTLAPLHWRLSDAIVQMSGRRPTKVSRPHSRRTRSALTASQRRYFPSCPSRAQRRSLRGSLWSPLADSWCVAAAWPTSSEVLTLVQSEKMDLSDLSFKKGYSGPSVYAQTKVRSQHACVGASPC